MNELIVLFKNAGPYVIDLFQSTVDLQISFALQRAIVVSYLLYKNNPAIFQLVTGPIAPKYN